MTMPKPLTIKISIAETIRHQQWENIKPGIEITFDVPEDIESIEQYYLECYKVTKNTWNMHLYNMLFNVKKRKDAKSLMEFAGNLITSKEKMPLFKFKKKKE